MIPIILDPNKTYAQLVNDNTNGLGRLNDTLDCRLTEVLNGIYEVEMLVPLSDKHFKDLALGSYVKLKAGEVEGDQIFKVYFISRPIDEKVVVRLVHITYDLNKIPVSPFTATGSVSTKNQLLAHVIGSSPFDMVTDINNTTSVFTLDIPKSFRECLGGWEGSILDTFRCEYEWDNLTVKMLAHRGSDNGVRIAYGKNLTDFKQEENIENVYTSVLGYAVVNEQTYVGDVYHKIVSNMPKVKIVDFSSDFGDTTPTTAQLTQKAQDYATRNAIEVPNVSIDIKFVPLYQTEEYKNIAPLERVGLGDTVHVYFEKLGVEATSRVVKRVWNVLTERYESIELGDTKANLTTLLDDAVQEAKENITIDAGFIESEMNEMSQLIINGLGLHRTLVPLATGGHRMYLHNKPSLADSDTQYVITSGGFMISQDYGQTWNSGWDASGNAVMNSLSTITLKALEIYGSYIQGTTMVFGDPDDDTQQYIRVTPNNQGVTFQGTGTIRMEPQSQFIVDNKISGRSYNIFNINPGYIGFTNYNRNYNYFANKIDLYSLSYGGGNYIRLDNYSDTVSSVLANYIELFTSSSEKKIRLYNARMDGSTGNYIEMLSNSSGSTFNLTNYTLTGDIASSIEMSTTTMKIYNRLDIYVYSDGAVRLKSSNSQDITLTSDDDIYMSWGNKLRMQGREIKFGTVNGVNVLTWTA